MEVGINFAALTHLDSLGLIRFDPFSGFSVGKISKDMTVFYYDRPVHIEFPKSDNSLGLGYVLFTQAGAELASICKAPPFEDFFNLVLERWFKKGLILSMPIKKLNG